MKFRFSSIRFPHNRLFFKFSIKYRLLLYFLFLVFLPISIISTTIYYKSRDIITERVYNTINTSLDVIDTSFRQKLEDINDVMTMIYFTPELQAILSSRYFTTQSQTVLSPQYSLKSINMINEMSSLDRIFDGYSMSNTTRTTLYPKFYIYHRPEYLFINSSEKVTDLSRIENEAWYRKVPPECRYYVTGLNSVTTPSGQLTTLRIVKRLFGLKNAQIPYAGLLTMDAGIETFNNILRNYKPSAGSTTYVVDNENSIIACSDAALVGTRLSGEVYIEGMPQTNADMIVFHKKIGNPDFTIVSVSSAGEMYGQLVSLNVVMFLVLGLCLLLSVIVALILSENVSYPIRKLAKSMSVVRDGNFDVSLNYKRNDEFSFLVSAFNKMVSQIKELINKLYVSELNKKEAELETLQAQINPHFLYNTLDSVNWLALKHDVPDISVMVTSLSDFFRYSLSKGHNIIPLGDEKKQVESYLEIQRLRFRDKLDYTIDFPQEILGFYTVKLIMQPIIENAILHGIEKKRGKGMIGITASMAGDGAIEIRISDNGAGADIGELNGMLSEKTGSSKSYGIKNVNERIKHTFGENYGLTFERNEPEGVTAIIRIPVIRSLEGYNA